MNKNKILTPALALAGLILFASCGGSSPASSSLLSNATSSSASTSLTSSPFSSASVLPLGVSQGNDAQATRLHNHPSLSVLQAGVLNSIGKRKILVVPITFQNCASFTSGDIAAITKAYNGSAEETGWQSLKSYYETSSYGQLDIESTIASPYVVPLDDYNRTTAADTASDLSFEGQIYRKKYSVESLADDVVKKLAENYTLSDYDQDQDGLLDGLEMVYIGGREWNGDSSDPTEVWWNFTSIAHPSNEGSTPLAGIFFWSQLSQLENGYYSPDIDAHTLVHESGHMLGLNDYYCYDTNDDGRALENPAGFVDMMDCNIADQNAYSKYALGWVNPKYVNGQSADFSLTLSSFADTGDCLLFRNTTNDPWNQTPYDEYLLLQYFTPSGDNEQDSVKGYPEWKNSGVGGAYKKPGLQLFHVDARTAINADTPTQIAYSDKLRDDSFIVADNTPSYSLDVAKTKASGTSTYNSSNRLLEAIPATGIDYFGGSSYEHFGDQAVLFGLPEYGCGGTTFSMASMKNLFPNGTLFNDGSEPGYAFTITAQTDKNITLHFYQA